MDDSSQKPQNTSSGADLASELTHVTQEMYKKNFELVERNKTLLLLRKIHEIILSSVTDTQQIAQQAADVVVSEADFKAVIIFLLDKESNSLLRLAVSQTEPIAKMELELKKPFCRENILLNEENLVVNAVKTSKSYVTHSFADVLTPYFSPEEAQKAEAIIGIKSSLVYPFVVRGEVIGAMIICIGESETSLFGYQQDLIDRLTGVIGIAIDNAELYQEIQRANEKLKQLDKLKDEFVSLASHELRTPMTSIKSYLWMALAGRGGVLNEKQKYYLDRAYKATQRLINLVSDMLNVSRIESGRITLDLKEVDLNQLIADVVAELSPRAQELGISLVFNPDLTLPHVLADADKIKEVIINLVGNSLKFTPKGGTITIDVSEVSNREITVSVSDTGAGLTKEDMQKLFVKFGMVGNNVLQKQNAQGTGLGLYISKSIIQLHGGTIVATSDGLGKGSKFTFPLKIFSK